MPANALQRRCGGLFDHLERLTTRNIILSITTLLALMAGCATYFFIIFKSMSGAGRLHWMFREHPWVFASIPGMLCCATVILIPVSVLRHPSSVRIIFFFLVAWIAVLILSTIQLYTIQCTCNFQKSMFFECRVVQEIGLNAPWRDKITVANPFKDLTPFLQNPKGLKSKEKQKIRDRAADMSKLREAEEEEEKQVAASEQIGKEANKTDTTKRGKPILDKEKTEKKPDDENAEKKPDDENAEKKPDEENAEENEAALLEVTVPVTARVRDAKPQQTADGAAQVSFLQVEARGLVKSSGNTEKLADIPDTKPPPGKERRMYIQREYQNEIKRVAALEGLSLQQIEKPRTKEDDDDEDDSNDDDDDDDDDDDSDNDYDDQDAEGKKKAGQRESGADPSKNIETWSELSGFVEQEFEEVSSVSSSPVLMGNVLAICNEVVVAKRSGDVTTLSNLAQLKPKNHKNQESVFQDVKSIFMGCIRKMASSRFAGCIGVKIMPANIDSYKVCQIRVDSHATSFQITLSKWKQFRYCFNQFWLRNRQGSQFIDYCLEKITKGGNQDVFNKKTLEQVSSWGVSGASQDVMDYYHLLHDLFLEYRLFLDVKVNRDLRHIQRLVDLIARCQNERTRLRNYWPVMYKLQLGEVQIEFEDYGRYYEEYDDISKMDDSSTSLVDISNISPELAFDHKHKTPGYHFASRVATLLKIKGVKSSLMLRRKRRDGSGDPEDQEFRDKDVNRDGKAFKNFFAETIKAGSDWIVEEVEVSLNAPMSEFEPSDASLENIYRLPMMSEFTFKCPAKSKYRDLDVSPHTPSQDQIHQNFAENDKRGDIGRGRVKQKRLKLMDFTNFARSACRLKKDEDTSSVVLLKITWRSMGISKFKYDSEKDAFRTILQFELSGKALKIYQKATNMDDKMAQLWSECRCNAQGCIPFKDSLLRRKGLMWCTIESSTIEDCRSRTTNQMDVGNYIFDSKDGRWTSALCDSFNEGCKCSGVGMKLSNEDMRELKGPNYESSSENLRAVGKTCEAGSSQKQTNSAQESASNWCFVGPHTTCMESFVQPANRSLVWKKHEFQSNSVLSKEDPAPGQYLSRVACHQEVPPEVFEVESECYFVTTWLLLHFIVMILLTMLMAFLLLIWLGKRLSDKVHSHFARESTFISSSDEEEEEEEEEEKDEEEEAEGGGGLFGF